MRVAEGTRRVADYEPRLGQPFDLQGELDAKTAELGAIDKALAETKEDETPEEDEFAEVFGSIGGPNAFDEEDESIEAASDNDLAA